MLYVGQITDFKRFSLKIKDFLLLINQKYFGLFSVFTAAKIRTIFNIVWNCNFLFPTTGMINVITIKQNKVKCMLHYYR